MQRLQPKPLESPGRKGRSSDARSKQFCKRFTATLSITMGVAQEKQSRLSALVIQALRMAEQKSLQHRMKSPGHPKAHLPISSAIHPESLAPKNFQMIFQATYSELIRVPHPSCAAWPRNQFPAGVRRSHNLCCPPCNLGHSLAFCIPS